MKKLILFAMLAMTAKAAAQSGGLSQDFLVDAEVLAEVEAQEAAQKAEAAAVKPQPTVNAADAQAQARKLLEQRPRALRKQSFPKLRQRAVASAVDRNPLNARQQGAPFGLMWGATMNQTRNQGIMMTPVEQKDYVNSFKVTRLPKAIDDFGRVIVTFGDGDRLWRILAYGRLIDDNASAEKVMQLYKIYDMRLSKKYGNAQEYFTPAQIDVVKKDKNGKDIMVQESAPIGNPQFLSQLQSGAAVLYSVYHNNQVEAALAVNVDGDGKSYIVVDYKNLILLNEQEKETMDAL